MIFINKLLRGGRIDFRTLPTGGAEPEKFDLKIFYGKAAAVLYRFPDGKISGHQHVRNPPAATTVDVIVAAGVVVVADVASRHPQLQSPTRLSKTSQHAENRRTADRRMPLVHVAVNFRRRRMIQRLKGIVNNTLLPGLSLLHRASPIEI